MRITDLTAAAMLVSLPALAMDMDDMPVGYFAFDHLEQRFAGDDQRLAWEAEGWYGTDFHKLVLNSTGERDAGGPTESSETRLLYRRELSEFFDWQAGIRYDDQPGPSRSHAVLGLKGLAPQWIELDANLFLSERGDPSLRLEVEYELLLTQRWVLEPKLEYDLALGDDRDLDIGAGGSTLETGLRLHYRVTPAFSPYVGYTWEKTYGRSGGLLRAAGEDDEESAWVVGLRFWL
ncbi:copper resistance protein B [Zestomonas carbonaria]|uniref:Copper resistance protein B n=1 Tax=Zestomonas carbonaria TaxID=2762745 RepID=A0A7U7ESZ0_9GAMM|nr:copper resistance protein B [Pseudomonas carbonaria]CAD5110293.1 Copper resistance protein B [Pseudomonas carbonaria]